MTRREDRAAVEAAPAPVHHGEDLVGHDHVGVELRVAGARVEVVVGDGGDAGDADLGDRAVAVGDAGPSRGDLALEEVDDVGDGRVVRVRRSAPGWPRPRRPTAPTPTSAR